MREGYKKTEIGVIPLDWEVTTIGEKTISFDGKRVPLKSEDRQLIQGEYPYYGAQGIIDYINDYIFDGEYLLVAEDGENVKEQKYDIAFIVNGRFWLNNHAHILQSDSTMNLYFISTFLNHINIIKYVTGTGQPKLNKAQLNSIKIPLPPLTQQKKIAQILSRADEKIEAIALQIEKAEMVKKGLMQRLLNNESWEIKTLDSVATITMGQSPKSSTYNQEKIGIPLIQGNADCKNRKTVPRTYTTELTKECFVGDIIMTVRAPVGAISKSLHNACIGRGVCSIKPNEENEFLYHFLVNYEDKWDKLSQGSTFTAVSGSDIRSIKLFFPPLKEQTKIANILSTADEKLEVLRAKKVKYEELKVGLMQKLLTGEVRV